MRQALRDCSQVTTRRGSQTFLLESRFVEILDLVTEEYRLFFQTFGLLVALSFPTPALKALSR